MTQTELDAMTGAEFLRLLVQNLNACNETFLDPFTAEQLIQIGRMHLTSPWDFSPDQWTNRQVREALKGIAPHWTEGERPYYGPVYFIRKGERDQGPFTTPAAAGRAWPSDLFGVLLVADYRTGSGTVDAIPKDVDTALAAMLRARKAAAARKGKP